MRRLGAIIADLPSTPAPSPAELPGWAFLLIVLAAGAFMLPCMIVHWLGALVVFAVLIWSIGRLLLWLVPQLLR